MEKLTAVEELGEAIGTLARNVSQHLGKGSPFESDLVKLDEVYQRMLNEASPKKEADASSVPS